MRFQVNAIFALHTRQGLVFGCVTEVDGAHMRLQVPCNLKNGEILDWRMQLVGRKDMVTGSLRVEGQVPEGDPPSYDAQILAMSDENRVIWQSWLIERTSSSASSGDRPPVPKKVAGRAANETVHISVEGRFKDGPSSEPPGPAPAGRGAITAALKATLAKNTRVPLPQQRAVNPPGRMGRIDQPRPSDPPITEMRLPPALEHAPLPPPNPSGPASADPAIAIRAAVTPVQMLLRYRTLSAYLIDYDRYLRGSGLFVPVVEVEVLRKRGTRVRVRLELPSGAWLISNAEVVAPMTEGVGLALELNAEQRRLLATEAQRSA